MACVNISGMIYVFTVIQLQDGEVKSEVHFRRRGHRHRAEWLASGVEQDRTRLSDEEESRKEIIFSENISGHEWTWHSVQIYEEWLGRGVASNDLQMCGWIIPNETGGSFVLPNSGALDDLTVMSRTEFPSSKVAVAINHGGEVDRNVPKVVRDKIDDGGTVVNINEPSALGEDV
ncbi:hypothetical protein C8R44DRAFT_846546 [Mycena epipterygia]|nr:hypothetical protein C8R44DRAFT_846546 [Mycena epipterygia]